MKEGDLGFYGMAEEDDLKGTFASKLKIRRNWKDDGKEQIQVSQQMMMSALQWQ